MCTTLDLPSNAKTVLERRKRSSKASDANLGLEFWVGGHVRIGRRISEHFYGNLLTVVIIVAGGPNRPFTVYIAHADTPRCSKLQQVHGNRIGKQELVAATVRNGRLRYLQALTSVSIGTLSLWSW